MIHTPLFRTGYMSILLPVEIGEGEVRHIVRGSVIHALAATGECPIPVQVGSCVRRGIAAAQPQPGVRETLSL